MEPYSILAKYYDKFSADDCDYGAWAQYLLKIASSCGAAEAADIACGTGKMTRLLVQAGLRMTGIDVSGDMLNVARSKCRAVFVQQDMRKLALTHPTDMAVCVNDGVNYICPDELVAFFAKVAANLKGGAPFVFDVSSPYKLREIIGDKVFYWDGEDETLLWTNRFAHDSVRMDLTLFVREGDGYRRYDERHVQYAHTTERLADALDASGFDLREVSDCYGKELRSDSVRITFYATKR